MVLHDLISNNFRLLLEESLDFFEKRFILPVLDYERNVKIDFAAGLSEFDKKVIKRRIRKKIGNAEVYLCTIEDLILYKLFSARPIDIIDVEDLIKHNKDALDLEYLKATAKDFIEVERGDVLENLNKFLS